MWWQLWNFVVNQSLFNKSNTWKQSKNPLYVFITVQQYWRPFSQSFQIRLHTLSLPWLNLQYTLNFTLSLPLAALIFSQFTLHLPKVLLEFILSLLWFHSELILSLPWVYPTRVYPEEHWGNHLIHYKNQSSSLH